MKVGSVSSPSLPPPLPQYVEDLVTGLIKLMNSDYGLPCNLGNPEEYTVKAFALLVKELVTGSSSTISYMPATKDDPAKRKPDITVAREVLNWQPRVPVREGLSKTVAYFRAELEETVRQRAGREGGREGGRAGGWVLEAEARTVRRREGGREGGREWGGEGGRAWRALCACLLWMSCCPPADFTPFISHLSQFSSICELH